MSTKMKGIYKGFKYISNIFVVKEEREMEIGLPTDVKHVAHIGWDGERESAPSWMNEYKTAPDYSAASVNEFGASETSNNATAWSSRDFEESIGCQPGSEIFKNASVNERKASKKQKRKKIKSATSSPKSSSSMSRASRTAKSKASFAKSVSQLETTQNLQGMIP